MFCQQGMSRTGRLRGKMATAETLMRWYRPPEIAFLYFLFQPQLVAATTRGETVISSPPARNFIFLQRPAMA
jgi:hypothetical protein